MIRLTSVSPLCLFLVVSRGGDVSSDDDETDSRAAGNETKSHEYFYLFCKLIDLFSFVLFYNPFPSSVLYDTASAIDRMSQWKVGAGSSASTEAIVEKLKECHTISGLRYFLLFYI